MKAAYPSAPDNPRLRDIQHALARELGCESWKALKASIAERQDAAAKPTLDEHAQRVASFLEFACWDNHTNGPHSETRHRHDAARILRRHPEIARDSLYTPIVWPLFGLPDDDRRALEAVDLLLSYGADPTFKSEDGWTAADCARKRGLEEAADRLARAAAGGEKPASGTQAIEHRKS